MNLFGVDLCKYKNYFGEPSKGVHKYRFLGIAIVDAAFTVAGAYIFSLWLKQSFWLVLLVLFVLGIIMHRMFCVRTTLDKILFP